MSCCYPLPKDHYLYRNQLSAKKFSRHFLIQRPEYEPCSSIFKSYEFGKGWELHEKINYLSLKGHLWQDFLLVHCSLAILANQNSWDPLPQNFEDFVAVKGWTHCWVSWEEGQKPFWLEAWGYSAQNFLALSAFLEVEALFSAQRGPRYETEILTQKWQHIMNMQLKIFFQLYRAVLNGKWYSDVIKTHSLWSNNPLLLLKSK